MWQKSIKTNSVQWREEQKHGKYLLNGKYSTFSLANDMRNITKMAEVFFLIYTVTKYLHNNEKFPPYSHFSCNKCKNYSSILAFPQDVWGQRNFLVLVSLCPGTRAGAGASKCPGTNFYIPGPPGSKSPS